MSEFASWVVAPILAPAVAAAVILTAMRHRLSLSRTTAFLVCFILIGIGGAMVGQASTGAIEHYAVGSWSAPFGIVLVLDRLSALMVLLTSLLALAVLTYAVATGLDRKGWHFHPLFQFQLLGLNGAFLTGDVFNLFVFFEVMLIASYGLMLHAQGQARLKAGVQYVIVNLAGSTLFLVAVGILYGVTGTLNMADMAVRVAVAPVGDQALIKTGGMLLIAVFALKAALVPLHFWLPAAYASTSGAAAALFAIMTKVGAYCILRFTTLVFGEASGPDLAYSPGDWLLPAALMTAGLGFIGVTGSRGLREMAAFSVVGSMGVLLAAIAVFRPEATSAALYYLIHSTLAAAALFLIVDMIATRRGEYGDALTPGPRFARMEPLSLLFFLAAIAVVGLPPLSGFVGKLYVLDAVRGAPGWGWIWAVVLGVTLLGIIAFSRAGSLLFWRGVTETRKVRAAEQIGGPMAAAAAAGLLGLMALLTLFAGPVTDYTTATSEQLFSPDLYIRAILQGAPS